ncbi:hypothetical protein NQ315_015519 [Exocentrus adspersus]|uniref:Uncharacterized protein n=1 Tax=Exocentrus adspersus TaxID=1586481 RepID=A0AAV8VQ02_9CUCU|nr:hypothetical protein NQ315_015519 [Exocentrus adspersus]
MTAVLTFLGSRRRRIRKVEKTDDKPGGHYCWISNMSRLVSVQMSKKGHKRFIGDGCLASFSKGDDLTNHLQERRLLLPKDEDKYLSFTDHHKSYPVPFTIYADFAVNSRARSQTTKTLMCISHTAFAILSNVDSMTHCHFCGGTEERIVLASLLSGKRKMLENYMALI